MGSQDLASAVSRPSLAQRYAGMMTRSFIDALQPIVWPRAQRAWWLITCSANYRIADDEHFMLRCSFCVGVVSRPRDTRWLDMAMGLRGADPEAWQATPWVRGSRYVVVLRWITLKLQWAMCADQTTLFLWTSQEAKAFLKRHSTHFSLLRLFWLFRLQVAQ
jgi:hypothetical protein